MKNTALITGASSGIGRDLAEIHARHGRDLVIVARSEEKLYELKEKFEEEYKVQVKVLVKDLIKENACREIFDALNDQSIKIDYLINNAGFGGHGKFFEQDLEYQQRMIDLNIKALTKLTRLFLPQMIERNQGRILQVASVAGLVPGPLQAVYFATKAYVVSLSQALAEELSDTAVTCTALCPGATDTKFMDRADLSDTNMVKSGMASSMKVAQKGYIAMMNGKLIEITELKDKISVDWASPLVPRKMLLKIVRKTQEK